MLIEHRRRQLEERIAAGRHYQNLDLVFCNAIGGPLVRSTLERHLKSILAAANTTEHIRQYDLRHSFVTLSLVAGVDGQSRSWARNCRVYVGPLRTLA
jgi:integrase